MHPCIFSYIHFEGCQSQDSTLGDNLGQTVAVFLFLVTKNYQLHVVYVLIKIAIFMGSRFDRPVE